MANKKKPAISLEDGSVLMKRLDEESDRGAALVAAAWLDDALADMLRNHFVEDKKAVEDVFRPMGPLASFSAKIRLARLLGMVDENLFLALDMVRGVRNEFAHSREELTFEHPDVRKHLQDKRLPKPKQVQPAEWDVPPRLQFTIISAMLILYLVLQSEHHPRAKPPAEDYFVGLISKYNEEWLAKKRSQAAK